LTRISTLKNEIDGWEKKKILPRDMFLSQADRYSTVVDQRGIPTHDRDGKELTKGVRKKLEKEFNNQEKNYTSFQDRLAKDPEFLLRLRDEYDTLIRTHIG